MGGSESATRPRGPQTHAGMAYACFWGWFAYQTARDDYKVSGCGIVGTENPAYLTDGSPVQFKI